MKANTLDGNLDTSLAWLGENLASNALFNASGKWDTSSKSYILKLTQNDVHKVLPDLDSSMADLMNKTFRRFGVDANSNSASLRFLSRAADPGLTGSPRASAAVLEGAARLAAVAGVPSLALNTASMSGNAAASRTGLASSVGASTVALSQNEDGVMLDQGLSAGSGYKSGIAVWAMPLYQHENVSGLSAGEFSAGYNADLYGLALGGDVTIADTWRVGLSINAGGGRSRSHGDFATTKNDIDFWGLSLYGGWQWDRLTLSGDVGYTATDNELRQDADSRISTESSKADVKADVWTAGFKAEYLIPCDLMGIAPYAGVRFSSVKTDSHSVENRGSIFDMDETRQDVWLFPVGVTLSKDMDLGSGWMLTPRWSVGALFAAGDMDAESRVRVPGVDALAVMKTQAVDHAAFDTSLGLEIRNEAWALGLNYSFQASDKRNAHGVTASLRYAF